eukprot:m51a1_g9900 hypothetical protein (124) ;mRNA; f:74150-74521
MCVGVRARLSRAEHQERHGQAAALALPEAAAAAAAAAAEEALPPACGSARVRLVVLLALSAAWVATAALALACLAAAARGQQRQWLAAVGAAAKHSLLPQALALGLALYCLLSVAPFSAELQL